MIITATQLSIEEIAFSRSHHITKREKFLDRMEIIVPWEELNALVAPYYYNNRKGRKPVELDTMIRMYLLREWFTLSDTAVEDAVYDSYAMRRFLRLDFNGEKVPDASTLGKFRKLLGRYKLTKQFWDAVNACIDEKGYKMKKSRLTEPSVQKVSKRKK